MAHKIVTQTEAEETIESITAERKNKHNNDNLTNQRIHHYSTSLRKQL